MSAIVGIEGHGDFDRLSPLDPEAGSSYFLCMKTYQPMEREPHTLYRVFMIEKLIIHFALPSDLVFHTYGRLSRRTRARRCWSGSWRCGRGRWPNTRNFWRVKDENGGTIPEDYQKLCRQTPCGKTRLFLASLPWRHPKRARSVEIANQNIGPGVKEMPPVPVEDVADEVPARTY